MVGVVPLTFNETTLSVDGATGWGESAPHAQNRSGRPMVAIAPSTRCTPDALIPLGWRDDVIGRTAKRRSGVIRGPCASIDAGFVGACIPYLSSTMTRSDWDVKPYVAGRATLAPHTTEP
jgi:hypothetical protein